MAESFIERLRKAVAIPSVSADEEKRPEVVKVSEDQISNVVINKLEGRH